MQIVKTAPLVIAESPKYLYLPLVVNGKGDNSEKPRAQINQSFSRVKIGCFWKCAPMGIKRKEDTMDKLTFTAVEKKGDVFASFRFGGFNLTTGKTLAQSLIDNASSDKALAGGLYATCAALVDIARERGYLLSSAVVACVSDENIRDCADDVAKRADRLATLRKRLTRAKRDADRLAYLPIKGMGGNADEQRAREKSLMATLQTIRARIAVITEDIETANADYRAAVDNLRSAERAYYEENAKKNAKKNSADTSADNNNTSNN